MSFVPRRTIRAGLTVFAFIAALGQVGLAAHAIEPGQNQPNSDRLNNDSTGEPVVLPRAVQFDFASRINGQVYRLMVSTPAKMQPGTRYPVFYVLDGYWYFHAAARMVPAEPADHLMAAIVVGVGYPTDEMAELLRRRTFDLTPPPVAGAVPAGAESGTGGVDEFLHLLLDEVRPFINHRYPVDESRQAIFGMSNGGVAVLRLLFRHPEAFQAYIAGSPAIYHNDRAVLADEAAFSAQIRAGNLQLKLLITTAANEQYRGNDPKLLAADGRFVDNAADLAARLAPLHPATFKVVYTTFADETHKSASLPALSRALMFALKPD
ncbi:MAG: alpha/beta hydrolase-fold protein [Opitutae bacterium]|nr:alpha/beta hydrolase-fold protein [Opitutae bacterium]